MRGIYDNAGKRRPVLPIRPVACALRDTGGEKTTVYGILSPLLGRRVLDFKVVFFRVRAFRVRIWRSYRTPTKVSGRDMNVVHI